jgi:multiple sugar transport system permease protein
MPNIITAATVAILFGTLFGYPMGPVNDLLTRFHIIDKPFYFLNSRKAAQSIIIFIQTWQWYGYTMIILISGVLGIDPEIFEAADIDGANGWTVFWKITIPSIKTIMLFTLVTSLIGGLTMFDIPQLFINNGGPDNATVTTSVFIYAQAFKGGYMYNRASAASMVMFIIIIILSAFMFFLLRDKDEAALKKQAKEAARAAKIAQKNAALEGGSK